MKTVIAASKNKHKIDEISKITEKYGIRVISRDEAGIEDFEIEEDGKTFEENSFKKAKAIFDITGKTTIADDSGLSVDYLGGAPGVYSARFAGEGASDDKNNEKLLKALEGVAYGERSAKFICVITLILESGESIVARGECKGHIIEHEVGECGFGYDPVFIPEGYSLTYAQMSEQEKNSISHRANALKALEEELSKRV